MKARSASTWLGCGCALAITIFMLGVLAVTYLSYRAGESLGVQAAEPELAAERVRELLPYDELPAGYEPVGAMSVPLLVDMAFLRGPDGEGVAHGEGSGDEVRRGFLFLRFRDLFGRGERTRELLAGEAGDDQELAQEEIRFEPSETVARGTFETGGAAVTWTARRGRIRVDRSRFGVNVESESDDEADRDGVDDGPSDPAILGLADLDCGDSYQRIAVWFAPDPEPEVPTAEVDWSGTPADPAAVRSFLGHFRPCA